MITKACTGICKQELTLDKFYKSRYGRLGTSSSCRECTKLSREKKNSTINNVDVLDEVIDKVCACCKGLLDGINKRDKEYICNSCSAILKYSTDTTRLQHVINYLDCEKDKLLKEVRVVIKDGDIKEISHSFPKQMYIDGKVLVIHQDDEKKIYRYVLENILSFAEFYL
jgi:hypothetical protein